MLKPRVANDLVQCTIGPLFYVDAENPLRYPRIMNDEKMSA